MNHFDFRNTRRPASRGFSSLVPALVFMFLAVSCSSGPEVQTGAYAFPDGHLATLVPEDTPAILEIRDVEKFGELLPKQAIFKSAKFSPAEWFSSPNTQKKLAEAYGDAKKGEKELFAVLKSVKSVTICIFDFKASKKLDELLPVFVASAECDAERMLAFLKKIKFTGPVVNSGDVEIISYDADGYKLGFMQRGSRFIIGDLASMIAVFSEPPKKPLASNAAFAQEWEKMKTATAAFYMSGKGAAKLAKSVPAIAAVAASSVKAFELDGINCITMMDDLSEGKFKLGIHSNENAIIWKLIDLPLENSKLLDMVPADAPFYGTMALGKIEEILAKISDFAFLKKDTPEGKELDFDGLHKSLSNDSRDMVYLKKYKIREIGFFSFSGDLSEIGYLVRLDSADQTGGYLETEFRMKDAEYSSSEQKITTSLKVEDYKGAKIYSLAYESYLREGDNGEWILECAESHGGVPKNRYAAVWKSCIASIAVPRGCGRDEEALNVMKKCVDAAVGGEGVSAASGACTAALAINVVPLFDKWASILGVPPVTDVAMNDFTLALKLTKHGPDITLEMNSSFFALAALPLKAIFQKVAGEETLAYESMARMSLHKIHIAEEQFKIMSGKYDIFMDLIKEGCLSEDFMNPEKSGGYKFTVNLTDAGGFEARAVPTDGKGRLFFINESGVLRVSDSGEVSPESKPFE
jgi:hypothetical protein